MAKQPTFLNYSGVSVIVSEGYEDDLVRIDVTIPGDTVSEHVVVYVNGKPATVTVKDGPVCLVDGSDQYSLWDCECRDCRRIQRDWNRQNPDG